MPRGAPPANQNARKHGFYSKALSSRSRHALSEAASVSGIDEEIALLRLRHLVLEVKGQDSQQDQTKRTFLDEWVRAVNAHGGFGKWRWAVSKNPSDVVGILREKGVCS